MISMSCKFAALSGESVRIHRYINSIRKFIVAKKPKNSWSTSRKVSEGPLRIMLN
jgi:hypothetical protein